MNTKLNKRIIVGIFAFVIAMSIMSCADKADYPMNPNVNSAMNSSNYFSRLEADWPYYANVEDLIDAADEVFEGAVTNIYFACYDMKTGQVYPPVQDDLSGKKYDPMIYTVYEISTTKVYKGFDESIKKVLVMGGKESGNVSEQIDVVMKYNQDPSMQSIPILDGIPNIKTGESYLWVTRKSMAGDNKILNPEQLCFKENEIIDSSTNIIDYKCIIDFFKK